MEAKAVAVEHEEKKSTFKPPEPDVNPIGHMLADYKEWVEQQQQKIDIEYDEEEDVFRVTRGDMIPVVVYPSEIDFKFYHDDQAVFVEAEIGPPGPIELDELMKFSGDELVLSRISQAERDEDDYMVVVEAALPVTMVEFPLLDLMVREVANIAADIRAQLGNGDTAAEEDDDEEEDPEDEEE
ncbi:MAG: hypothetical protein HY319_17085 [Armatimonadetes bacterium]|nr:hypothetical protein [Armatimonadota bacterium]